jgi:hypothetical protein
VLIGTGLALTVKIRWVWLVATWELMTGIVWLLAMLMGLLGRGYDFSFAGWAVGIAMATYIFCQDRQDAWAGQARNESTGSPDPLQTRGLERTRRNPSCNGGRP